MDAAVTGDLWLARLGADNQLVVGDRVVIRFLDDPKANPLCFILSDRSDDRLNGFLSLLSPLAKALCAASPGDEIVVNDGNRKRPVLYMTLEHEVHEVT